MNKTEFLNNVKNKVTDSEYSLIQKALNVFKNNEYCDESMPWGNVRVLLPNSKVFKGIWNWDTAFHAVGLSYFDIDFAMGHIEAFLKFQSEDGAFPDVVRLWRINLKFRRTQKSFRPRRKTSKC